MTIKKILFLASVVCVLSFVASAQLDLDFDFYNRGPYRDNVPRPQSILRFDVGDHHTTYAQMEQVIEAIAAALRTA